jgi:hypothetical protein
VISVQNRLALRVVAIGCICRDEKSWIVEPRAEPGGAGVEWKETGWIVSVGGTLCGPAH